MKLWIRRFLQFTFGLVTYERLDFQSEMFLKMMRNWESDRMSLIRTIDSHKRVLESQTYQIADLVRRNRDLMLRGLILDVSPIESMDRALDYLKGSGVHGVGIDEARKELENGLENYRKQNGGKP